MFLVAVGVISSLVLAGLMIVSGSAIDGRFWPPGEYDWRYWTYSLFCALASISLAIIALSERGAFWFAGAPIFWTAIVVAAVEFLVVVVFFYAPRSGTPGGVAAVGSAGFLAATLELGVEQSMGMEGDLRTEGYYRYSRNPQLVCLILVVAGIAVAANTVEAVLVACGMIVWFDSMPAAEEPWLREQFGEAYDAYCEHVPRFVGPKTARELWVSFRRGTTSE
ncbi:MAG: isoprenylcysteine carboxylmethyltransferase family protein [Bradymonadaceae bacterium]